MGNHLSFSGYGATPESACKCLEKDVQKIYPNAFVTISGDDVRVLKLSPRSVARIALVGGIAGNEGRPVVFDKDKYGIICTVKI